MLYSYWLSVPPLCRSYGAGPISTARCDKDLVPTEPRPRVHPRKVALPVSDRVGLASEAALHGRAQTA